MLKDIDPLEMTRYMPTCGKCNQTYHQSHFVSGNGPRYLICGRCAVETGLVTVDEAPQFYSDELARARLVLYSKRYRPLAFTSAGWILFLTLGRGIELWSGVFFGTLLVATLATPVLHFLGSAGLNA